jgi:hypothetical protein
MMLGDRQQLDMLDHPFESIHRLSCDLIVHFEIFLQIRDNRCDGFYTSHILSLFVVFFTQLPTRGWCSSQSIAGSVKGSLGLGYFCAWWGSSMPISVWKLCTCSMNRFWLRHPPYVCAHTPLLFVWFDIFYWSILFFFRQQLYLLLLWCYPFQ